MLRFFVPLVVFSAFEVHARSRYDGGRIVNGEEVPHKDFPFLVSIEYYDPEYDEWTTTCGGSIVNKVTVLTACHCATVDGEVQGLVKYIADPKERRIVAGTAYWNQNRTTKQIARVERIVTHPKCQNFFALDKNFINDVALYFLKDPLIYSPEVRPLKLPSRDIVKSVQYLKKLVATNSWCMTVGWGRTLEKNMAASEKLFRTAVELLKPGTCRKRFCSMTSLHCHTDFDRNGQFCVASPRASDCFGDSGGPLVCNGFVVGTVSYGVHCLPKLPTVYQGLQPILEILNIFKVLPDTKSHRLNGSHQLLDDTHQVRPQDPESTHKFGEQQHGIHRILTKLSTERNLINATM